MAYSGFYVFGDSLVDAGNALKLAEFYGDLTFSDLPDGAPTAELGYHQGRFSDGYNFADLLANKTIGTVTKPIFPYGYEDPWIGIPIAPWASDPNGINLNFAYGGAQIRQGDEAVPDLDGQTDAFRHAVDADADPNALYLVTIGGNDVRSLAPSGSAPALDAVAYAALDAAAAKYLTELSQLIEIGVKNILITGVPDVGLIPKYDRQDPGQPGYNTLDALELERSAAATEFSIYLDEAIRNTVIPELVKLGAVVTYVPLMDYVDENGVLVTGALTANLPTIAALHGLTLEELTGNLLEHRDLLFFDDIHPNAQANALLGAYMHAKLTKTEWIEVLPLSGPEMNFTVSGAISVAGEVDKTIVSLVAGTTYAVEMLGMSSLGLAGNIGDGSLSVLNPGGIALTQFTVDSGNDSGAGFDAMFTFTAPTSGNYTFAVSGVGALTGTYTLQAGVVGGGAMTQANTYTVNSAATGVIEGVGGFGVDVVKASVSYALSAGSEIESLQTTNAKGKTAINLTGNEFGQAIIGNSASNVLEGKGGADTFTGGAGKDVFVLSNTAVTAPGAANIDRITDYALGDVVDVTQVLSVVAGTNVVSDGWLRVTTSLVQVDPDGGGDEWVTLSTVNGTGAVAVRYLSGGVVTNVSVTRVAEDQLRSASAANTNIALAGAVAAAGLEAAPAAAETTATGDESLVIAGASVASGPIERGATSAGESTRSELTGEAREALDEGVASIAGTDAGVASSSRSLAGGDVPIAPVTELSRGTDTPTASHTTADAIVADAVAMPSAEMLQALQQDGAVEAAAKSTGELGRVLAEALTAGGAKQIDALLDALSGNEQVPAVAIVSHVAVDSWAMGHGGIAAIAAHQLSAETIALHHDAPPTA